MKNIIASLALLLLSLTAVNAQDSPAAPKAEFTITVASSSAKIHAGESTSVDIDFLRSKAYKKSNVTLGLSSSLPAGVSIVFEPANGVIDHTTAKITATAEAKPGDYLVILKATMQNKAKGATLKLSITEPATETVTSKN